MASDSTSATIGIPIFIWRRVVLDLRRRAAGRRESGAFLLGRQGTKSRRVMAYVCYDDLDPHAYQSGGIAFHAPGYSALWQRCRTTHLDVLADVHTHPGEFIRQSCIDQQHPMLPSVGHTAIIVPNFAATSWWSLNAVGVYEYLGDFQWRVHPPGNSTRRIRLTPW